ncbi:hypothetical protein ACOME3_006053 [Neoechinorhynchus agilis]
MKSSLLISLLSILSAAFCYQWHVSSLTGRIIGEGRIPKNSIVKIRMDDVSMADASAKTIAKRIIYKPRRFPIDFEMEYDDNRIDPRRTYALSVRIERIGKDRKLLFINDQQTRILTLGNPRNNIKVHCDLKRDHRRDRSLAGRVSLKLADGDAREAVRLLSSMDSLAKR